MVIVSGSDFIHLRSRSSRSAKSRLYEEGRDCLSLELDGPLFKRCLRELFDCEGHEGHAILWLPSRKSGKQEVGQVVFLSARLARRLLVNPGPGWP